MDPRERYLQERVGTASPAELTAMLFDAAVAAIRLALRDVGDGSWRSAVPRLVRAQRLVTGLRLGLDATAGGEVASLASNLDRLYVWTNERLAAGLTTRTEAPLLEALNTLEPLATAWRQACLGAAA